MVYLLWPARKFTILMMRKKWKLENCENVQDLAWVKATHYICLNEISPVFPVQATDLVVYLHRPCLNRNDWLVFYTYRLTVVKVLHRVVRWNGNKQEFVLTVIIQNKLYTLHTCTMNINVTHSKTPNRKEQLITGTVKQSCLGRSIAGCLCCGLSNKTMFLLLGQVGNYFNPTYPPPPVVKLKSLVLCPNSFKTF